MTNNDLGNNRLDILTSIAKAAAGPLPIVGPFLTELIGSVIPNQRLDRITDYLQLLDNKISKISSEILHLVINEHGFVDLLEEGFLQASRAITDERREYISQIVVNGIDEEQIEYSESKSILQLLSETNDIQIIWLRYYGNFYTEDFKEFRQRHKEVLSPVLVTTNSEENMYLKRALQEHNCQHLERLGLLNITYSIDKKIREKEIKDAGKLKANGYAITKLGLVLLKQLGLIASITKRG